MSASPLHPKNGFITSPELAPLLAPSHPEHNYLPRIVGNSLCAPACSLSHFFRETPVATKSSDVTGKLASFNTAYSLDVNQSWVILGDITEAEENGTADLAALQLWTPGIGAGKKVVLAALPVKLANIAVNSFLRFGRALTWKEEFHTYSPPEKWEEALKPERATVRLPAGLEVGTLNAVLDATDDTRDDAIVVNAHWKYGGGPDVVRKLRENITSLPNACLRLSSSMTDDQLAGVLTTEQIAEAKANNNLVSWVLYRSDGSCGVMHSLPSFRGKSLAEHCVRALVSNEIPEWKAQKRKEAEDAGEHHIIKALNELVPYCHITPQNKASIAVFTKRLGYTPINRVIWMIFNKMAPRFHLRPINAHSEEEWQDLLALINSSYGHDDAFWVDLIRVGDVSELKEEVGREGVFFLGYEEEHAKEVLPPTTVEEAVGFDGDGYLPKPATTVPLANCYDERGTFPTSAAADGAATDAKRKKLICAFFLTPPRELKTDASSPVGEQTFSRCCSLRFATVSTDMKKCGVAQRVLDTAIMTAKQAYNADSMDIHVVSVKPWLKRFYEGDPESGLKGNGFKVFGREELPAVMTDHLIEPYRSLPAAEKPFFHHMARKL
jgi:hypothetical protein